MGEPVDWSVAGHAGAIAARTWPHPAPTALAALVPDYGDHLGRYAGVAGALGAAGAVVVGHDHAGHGRSAGARGQVADFEALTDDLGAVLARADAEHPGLPVVVVGHGLGGTVAARYAQRWPAGVAALVLAAPVLGYWQVLDLLSDNGFPDRPVDPALLCRDPAAAAQYAADPLVWHGGYPRATLRAVEEFLHAIDFDHPLGDELPALWLHGTDDELVPLAETRAGMDRIRGLRFEERQHAGARHDLWHEPDAGTTLAELAEFVSRISRVG